MERRTLLKSLALTIPALYFKPALVLSASNVTAILRKLNIPLSTAGRLSFYVDYSERSTLGDHTFYVCRTHGTSGRVSVNYATYGDSHNTASGSFTWKDGEADIKSFTTNVSSKVNGDHRIYALLSNPTGGAILHNGAKTIAYGVIDDGTIASDADAVFYDSAAAIGGNGTQVSPYNSLTTAIANLGSKRYLYGKGTTTPSEAITISGTTGTTGINIPATRTSETTRLYIQKWPGFTWTIDGGVSTTIAGFYAESGQSYQTFKSISFINLNNSGNAHGFGIFYHYGNSTDINIEYCTGDNINGRAGNNNGSFMVWGVSGAKVWRCTSNNIQTAGDNTNQNTAGVFYYSAENISVQRCEFSNSSNGVFAKRTEAGAVLVSCAFNIFKTDVGIRYGYASPAYEPNFGIAISNLFKNCPNSGIAHYGSSASQAGKNWICNNVFDNSGSGDVGAVYARDTYDIQIFNNIFYNCRKMWDIPETVAQQSNTSKKQIEYADYNHDYGTTLTRYEYLSVYYNTSAALNAASGFAANDSSGDPLFTNPTQDNYTLKKGSPCLGTGVVGTDKGIYLTGIERLGPAGIGLVTSVNISVPVAPAFFTVS